MGIRLITADERLAAADKTTAVVLGPSGVGKTSLLKTTDPETTFAADAEAGLKAVQDWRGTSIDIREESAKYGVHPWVYCRALICWLGGPDPAAGDASPYSMASYQSYVNSAAFGDLSVMSKFKLFFLDSITVVSRWAFDWCQRQPEAFAANGKPDTRGAYGLVARELIAWFTQVQHMKLSTIIVGILDRKEDDLKRVSWEPQIVGSSAALALPGIFDQVITMQIFETPEGAKYRALICTPNQWNYPGKDRSGRLDMMEPPDLGRLITKMSTAPRIDGTMTTTLPPPPVEKPLLSAAEVPAEQGTTTLNLASAPNPFAAA